jgi:type IV secretory pathway VirJ component
LGLVGHQSQTGTILFSALLRLPQVAQEILLADQTVSPVVRVAAVVAMELVEARALQAKEVMVGPGLAPPTAVGVVAVAALRGLVETVANLPRTILVQVVAAVVDQLGLMELPEAGAAVVVATLAAVAALAAAVTAAQKG